MKERTVMNGSGDCFVQYYVPSSDGTKQEQMEEGTVSKLRDVVNNAVTIRLIPDPAIKLNDA